MTIGWWRRRSESAHARADVHHPHTPQDELLARAYFRDAPLGTSIRFRYDLRQLRYSQGEVVRQGVEVQHLAFCEHPVRRSTVRRVKGVPASHPRTRNARALLG